MKRKRFLFLAALFCLSANAEIDAATLIKGESIGPPMDYGSVKLNGISDDGNVVIGSTNGSPFIWSDGVYNPSWLKTYSVREISAVSTDGLVVVGTAISQAGVTEAFRRVGNDLNYLGHFPGTNESAALGLSSDGSIVVGYCSGASGKEAFIWSDGVMYALGDLPAGYQTVGEDVSADGSVVVGKLIKDSQATIFRWENGVLTDLDMVISLGGSVEVSDDGEVVMGFSWFSSQIWTSGVIETIAVGPFATLSLSADGNLVTGFVMEYSTGPHAGIFTRGKGWVFEFTVNIWGQTNITGLLKMVTSNGKAFAGTARTGDLNDGLVQLYRIVHAQRWGQWEVVDDHVSSRAFMGDLSVINAPWIWCHKAQCWFNIPDEVAESGNGWIYCADISRLNAVMINPNWRWSPCLGHFLYIPSGFNGSDMGWVYLN